MIRIYVLAAMISAVLAGLWRISYLSDERDKYQKEASEATATIEQIKRNQELEDWARSEYIKELETAKSEKDRIEKCIADKSCVATVRVRIPAVCPRSSEGDTAGTEDYAAVLSASALRTRANLESSIRDWEAKHALCMRTLKNWETK
jgi:hypothetical protein